MSHTPALWQLAASFAARAHRDDLRKDNETPYIAHPARVAMIVAVEFGEHDSEVLAAALLHDVIEDGSTDFDAIAAQFGRRVAELVAAVSKDARLPEEEREAAYDAQLTAGPSAARLIKLGDVLDNLTDSLPGAQRSKVLEKVRRAIGLAEGDPTLARAVARVRAALVAAE